MFALFFCHRNDDLVVCAPFHHAPAVGGAIYVYYSSKLVCNYRD